MTAPEDYKPPVDEYDTVVTVAMIATAVLAVAVFIGIGYLISHLLTGQPINSNPVTPALDTPSNTHNGIEWYCDEPNCKG